MAHTKQADGGRMFDDSFPALGVNVSTLERIASALAGSALAAWGLSRRSRAGWAGAAFGGALLYRGLSGRCLSYSPPGGRVGAAVASILGASPERQIDEDLQRFRQLQDSGMALP